MRVESLLRYALPSAVMCALGVVLLSAATPAAGQSSFLQNGKAGFVVAHISYALSHDASETGACPNGMTRGARQVLQASPAGARLAGESDADYGRRLMQLTRVASTAPNGQNLCANPEAGGPDPNYRTVKGRNVPAYGINLDGQVSRASGHPAPGTCAHDDFNGIDGAHGIDNQYFRAVGCAASFQSTGGMNTFDTEMLTGSWGILIALSGVDDVRNDNDVEVSIYANADPIELSPAREPLPSATYAADQDPRFRATTHGKIVNGVLTTEPVNVRFHWIVNAMRLERPLEEARLHATLDADGVLDGYLSGYTPVEAMYDQQVGFRNGTDETGQLSSRRMYSSNGAANVANYTCQGLYHALYQLADGDRDASGRCHSISTQYRVRAIPAFVVGQ